MDNVKKIMNSKYGQIGIRGLMSIILGISIFLAVYYGISRDYKSLCDGFAISGSCLLAIGVFHWSITLASLILPLMGLLQLSVLLEKTSLDHIKI